MLQVAYGGSVVTEDGSYVYDYEDMPVYYEPGFNLIEPLVISSITADVIYILLRKRIDSTGNSFEDISLSDIEATVIDSTNGESLQFSIVDANNGIYYGGWDIDSSEYSPLVIAIQSEIDLKNPIRKVRVIDCCVRDKNDNDFICFRIIENDSTGFFHYLHIETEKMSNRKKYTSIGNDIYVKIGYDSDGYILFSPYNYLKEVSNSYDKDFSYPLNTVFYKRQYSYNDEEYDFEIISYNRGFLQNVVSLMNVPNFHKAAIVLIDKYLYAELSNNADVSSYIVVKATGKSSGVSKNLTIRFIR